MTTTKAQAIRITIIPDASSNSNPLPVLTSLSSTFTNYGNPILITLTGSSFLPTSTCNYSTSHACTYVNSTTITMQLVAGDVSVAGAFPITVTNPAPGGGNSNNINFQVDGSTVSNPIDPSLAPIVDISGVPSYIWNTDMSTKVAQNYGTIPADGVRQSSGTIACEPNERCYGQIHLQAPAAGFTNLNYTFSDAVGTQFGYHLSSRTEAGFGNFNVAFDSYVWISTPSAISGSNYLNPLRGKAWLPFALIDKIDPDYHQHTNTLPYATPIPAGNNQTLTYDILAGTGTPSDFYVFYVYITSGMGASLVTIATVPVVAEIGSWIMPSTTAIQTENAPQDYDMCEQQFGGPTNHLCANYRPDLCGSSPGGDDTCGALVIPEYEAAWMLSHRWSMSSIGWQGGYSMATQQQYFGHLLAGTTSSTYINPELPGARLTTYDGSHGGTSATTSAQCAASLVTNSQWSFPNKCLNYACDEPSQSTLAGSCSTSMKDTIPAGVGQLVTTNYTTALAAGTTGQITIMCPIIEDLDGNRGLYNGFLIAQTSATLCSYTDCEASGSCSLNVAGAGTGYPAPHLDATPVANQLFGFMLFYTSATMNLNSTVSYCWSNNCGGLSSAKPWAPGGSRYLGWFDENWILPGVYNTVGVSTGIIVNTPVMANEEIGIEKYEYINYLKNNGQIDEVWTQVNSIITAPSNFNNNSYKNGSFASNWAAVNRKLFCDVQAIKYPGAKCAW